MLSPNQLGKRAVLAEDDDATQATTQHSRWRAGVNRQSQPQAQQHQIAASQAAAAKRTANAMHEEERKAKQKVLETRLRGQEIAALQKRNEQAATAKALAKKSRVELVKLDEDAVKELCTRGADYMEKWKTLNTRVRPILKPKEPKEPKEKRPPSTASN